MKLLLSMDQAEGALWKATDSLDFDLVFLTLLRLEEADANAAATPGDTPLAAKKRTQALFELVATRPEASALLEQCVPLGNPF